MNHTHIIRIWLLLALFTVFSSCEKSESDAQTEMVNTWIYESMNDYYFWYRDMPKIAPSGTISPEIYFNNLLYKSEDKWSFITDDFTGLMAELDGKPETMGFEPAYGQFTNTSNVFMFVLYVYKNSPAEKAGIKRGDIITRIDGISLTTDNYQELASKTSYTATMAAYNGSYIYETGTKIHLDAIILETDPVLEDTILNISGQKIGYICLSEFLSPETFISHVQPVMQKFKSEAIGNLIVDLRYNLGGALNSAVWLASSIAPHSVVNEKKVLVNLKFNDKVQPFMDSDGSSTYTFDSQVSVNLDLNRIYFLTTHYGTASASELVIASLEPYMNVTQVGEYTFGKYTGMWGIPDTENPPRHNYGIFPIVMKYSNANGLTDFKDGLAPDYPVEDDLKNALPFGDTNEPQLAKALSLITGVTKSGEVKPYAPIEFRKIYSAKQELKGNLFVR